MATRNTRAWGRATGCLAVMSFALVGCGTDVVKLDAGALEQLRRTPEIKVVHYLPPNLEVQGTTQFGYGAAAGTSAGIQAHARDQYAGDMMFVDPVLRIRDKVTTAVVKTIDNKNLTPMQTPVQDMSIERLRGVVGSGTVMDFATTYWAVAPLPYSQHDLVLYRGRARLVQFPEGKVLWQGLCDVEAEDSVGMPTNKSAPVTKGQAIAGTFENLADRCSDHLLAQFNASGAGR
ncbi:MAG: hypothetical protein U0172_09640 [Nitrospiraceae bacterium]